MRSLVLLVALAAGCTPQMDVESIEPFVAVAGYYSIMEVEQSKPAPPPVQGDVCPSCFGRGIVGDSVVMTKCLTCNGTGKLVKHPPVVVGCKDGKCSTPNTAR
jgi:RecJ-like exonuclease